MEQQLVGSWALYDHHTPPPSILSFCMEPTDEGRMPAANVSLQKCDGAFHIEANSAQCTI